MLAVRRIILLSLLYFGKSTCGSKSLHDYVRERVSRSRGRSGDKTRDRGNAESPGSLVLVLPPSVDHQRGPSYGATKSSGSPTTPSEGFAVAPGVYDVLWPNVNLLLGSEGQNLSTLCTCGAFEEVASAVQQWTRWSSAIIVSALSKKVASSVEGEIRKLQVLSLLMMPLAVKTLSPFPSEARLLQRSKRVPLHEGQQSFFTRDYSFSEPGAMSDFPLLQLPHISIIDEVQALMSIRPSQSEVSSSFHRRSQSLQARVLAALMSDRRLRSSQAPNDWLGAMKSLHKRGLDRSRPLLSGRLTTNAAYARFLSDRERVRCAHYVMELRVRALSELSQLLQRGGHGTANGTSGRVQIRAARINLCDRVAEVVGIDARILHKEQMAFRRYADSLELDCNAVTEKEWKSSAAPHLHGGSVRAPRSAKTPQIRLALRLVGMVRPPGAGNLQALLTFSHQSFSAILGVKNDGVCGDDDQPFLRLQPKILLELSR